MIVSIIAALSDNNVIGRNNGLPWHLSADLKRLKALTMGHHLLMGRKTFASLERPLPGRTIVVIVSFLTCVYQSPLNGSTTARIAAWSSSCTR